jgi:hypothetical protein
MVNMDNLQVLYDMADHTSHNHADMAVPTTPAAIDNHGGHSMAFHFGSDEVVLLDFWRTESAAGKCQ